MNNQQEIQFAKAQSSKCGVQSVYAGLGTANDRQVHPVWTDHNTASPQNLNAYGKNLHEMNLTVPKKEQKMAFVISGFDEIAEACDRKETRHKAGGKTGKKLTLIRQLTDRPSLCKEKDKREGRFSFILQVLFLAIFSTHGSLPCCYTLHYKNK